MVKSEKARERTGKVMHFMVKRTGLAISPGILITVLLMITFLKVNSSAAYGAAQDSTDKSMERPNVSDTYYKNMEEYKEERTAWYFVEDARLKYPDDHLEARRSNLPPRVHDDFQAWRFAEFGHWMEAGTGVIAARRKSMFEHDGINSSTFRVEQLTILLPQGLPTANKSYRIGDDNGPLVFWSLWGHSRPSCLAYATSGTIDVKVLPMPQDVAPERRKFFTGNPFVKTLSANIKFRFDDIADEVKVNFKKEGNPECEPFFVNEEIEFFWRPLSAVLIDYQQP